MITTQNYELYIIFRPDTEADYADKKINEFLTQVKADNIVVTRQGVRRIAYPIKKQWNGQYYLVTFDLELENAKLINLNTYRFNKDDFVMRQLITNKTDYLKQKAKESINQAPETAHHRELNKGRITNKKCISSYLGLREVDYKDADFLDQFTSPYAKIFVRSRTGSKAKYQRKVSQAIKRARHMGLMPFTSKWVD